MEKGKKDSADEEYCWPLPSVSNDKQDQTVREIWKRVWDVLRAELFVGGFEFAPFLVGWYNGLVDNKYKLPYSEDTVAFMALSNHRMFQASTKPYVQKRGRAPDDPIDECTFWSLVRVVKIMRSTFLTQDIDPIIYSDWIPENDDHNKRTVQLGPDRAVQFLYQSAGHVAGMAYYYRPTEEEKKQNENLFGVSVHPNYGGWFGFRGAIVFKGMNVPNLHRVEPRDVVPPEKRLPLLTDYSANWKIYEWRDIIPVPMEWKYEKEQREYFLIFDRDQKKELIRKIFLHP